MNRVINFAKKTLFGKSTVTSLILAYVGLILFFSIATNNFFSVRNFLTIGLYSSILGVLAIGVGTVMLAGEIDISVGSLMGLVGVTIAIMFEAGLPLPVVIFGGLATGAFSGLVNGLIVTKLNISSLIVTLATLAIFRGMAFVVSGGLSKVIPSQAFQWIGRGQLFNVIPVPLVLMILAFGLFSYTLAYTKFGRRVYATGGNAIASYLSGIDIDRTRLQVFIISGFMAGLAGLIAAAQTGAGLPRAGMGRELDAVTAVVLGGISLAGGKGSIAGTIIGVLILSTLNNGMVLMNIPSFYQQIARGGVLLLAVMIDTMRQR